MTIYLKAKRGSITQTATVGRSAAAAICYAVHHCYVCHSADHSCTVSAVHLVGRAASRTASLPDRAVLQVHSSVLAALEEPLARRIQSVALVAVCHHFANSGFGVVVKKRKEGLAAAVGCSGLLVVAKPGWIAFAVYCSALAVLALLEAEVVLVRCQ